MEGEDAEAINRDTQELAQASHKLAEQLYAQKTQPGDGGAQAGGGFDMGGQPGQAGPKDDDVVDADYTEVR